MSSPIRKSLAALAFALALPAVPAAAQAPAAPGVTVAEPLRRTVTEWLDHAARLEASARVEVRPRITGQVEQRHFRDGAQVQAGDLLFTIDRRPFAIATETARAEVARAQSRLDLAEQELQRILPLIRGAVAPQSQLDARRATQREAVAQLAAAQAQLHQAELELSWTEVRAPIAGRISDRRVDNGNLVQQNATLLTTIVALDPIYAVFDMSEADYLRIARRQEARQADYPVQLRLVDETDWRHEGRLDFLDSVLEARAGTLRARAVLANPSQFLTPGSFVRLRLWSGEGEALMIPDAAVVADQATRAVLTVAADGTVVPKPVALGPMVDGLRVVRSGLSAQDRVVINGLHRARPGARVTAEPGRIGGARPQVAQAQ